MDRSEYVTAEEARLMLGLTKRAMAQVLAAPDRPLPYTTNPADKRMKLIKRGDIEGFRKRFPKASSPKKAEDALKSRAA